MIPGATDQKYAPVSSGDYYVIVTDTALECPSQPSNIIPYYLTGVAQLKKDQKVMIYPNPSRDNVNIAYYLDEPGSVLISLFDAVGQEVKILQNNIQQDAGKHLFVMNGQNMDKGVYFIKVQTNTYSLSSKLILTK